MPYLFEIKDEIFIGFIGNPSAVLWSLSMHNMHSQIVKICLQLNLDVEIIGIFNTNVVCPHYFNVVLKS